MEIPTELNGVEINLFLFVIMIELFRLFSCNLPKTIIGKYCLLLSGENINYIVVYMIDSFVCI